MTEYDRGYRAALEQAAMELEQTAKQIQSEQLVRLPQSGSHEVLNTVMACAAHLRKMARP